MEEPAHTSEAHQHLDVPIRMDEVDQLELQDTIVSQPLHPPGYKHAKAAPQPRQSLDYTLNTTPNLATMIPFQGEYSELQAMGEQWSGYALPLEMPIDWTLGTDDVGFTTEPHQNLGNNDIDPELSSAVTTSDVYCSSIPHRDTCGLGHTSSLGPSSTPMRQGQDWPNTMFPNDEHQGPFNGFRYSHSNVPLELGPAFMDANSSAWTDSSAAYPTPEGFDSSAWLASDYSFDYAHKGLHNIHGSVQCQLPSMELKPCETQADETLALEPVGNAARGLDISFYIDPVTESKRPKVRKRTRISNGKVKRACFICRIDNRKCNDPCPRYQTFVRRCADQFKLPKFTCDIQTKFVEIPLFSTPPAALDLLEMERISGGATVEFNNVDAVLHTSLTPFFSIIDSLDASPWRLPSRHTPWVKHQFYMQGVLQWTNAFNSLLPQFKHHTRLVERCFRIYAESVCILFDDTRFTRIILYAAIQLALYYDQIRVFRMLENVDQAAINHFEAAIESRLAYFCEKLFKGSIKKKKISTVGFLSQLYAISWSPRLDRFLPMQHRDMVALGIGDAEAHPKYLPCGLLKTPEDTSQPDAIKPPCFCSWAIHWLPVACLQCVNYDAQSFRQALHDPTHPLYKVGLVLSFHLRTAAASSDSVFRTMTYSYCHAAVISMRTYLDCLSSATRFEQDESVFAHITPRTAILAQVILTALECAQKFTNFLADEDSSTLKKHDVSYQMDDWIKDTKFDLALKATFAKYVEGIMSSPPVWHLESIPDYRDDV